MKGKRGNKGASKVGHSTSGIKSSGKAKKKTYSEKSKTKANVTSKATGSGNTTKPKGR